MIDKLVDLQNSTTLSQARNTGGKKEMGKEEFLRLLTVQLANQDPMNPMDNSAFVAQLAQFASLEQLTNVGDGVNQLVSVSQSNNAANAVSLLDRDVQLATNKIGGPTEITYQLGSKAKSVTLEVRDSRGRLVHTQSSLPTDLGLNKVKVEGIEKGNYTFDIKAVDSKEDSIPVQASIEEHVKGVNFSGPVPILLLESGQQAKATEVIEIRTASTVAGHP